MSLLLHLVDDSLLLSSFKLCESYVAADVTTFRLVEFALSPTSSSLSSVIAVAAGLASL